MAELIIAPLSTPSTVSLAVWNAVCTAKKLYLQTEAHPSAAPVKNAGLSFESMDDIYASSEDFDVLNERIAERVTAGEGDRVYAVMGGSCLAQQACLEKCSRERGLTLRILPGISYARAAFPEKPLGLEISANLLPARPDTSVPLYIQELDSRILAGEVKNILQEFYPDDWTVSFARQKEDGAYFTETLPLYALDRTDGYFSSAVLYVPPLSFAEKTRFGYEDLRYVLKRLRAPDGCPWDREQTHKSLNHDLREECYELMDAVEEENDGHIIEELGDVLMQVLFHAVMGEETGDYTDLDVTDGIVKKLIYRHPHVFGTEKAETVEQVLTNWDALKRKEKDQKTYTDTLRSVPKSFPAALQAQKVQKKAGKIGFDFADAGKALVKLYEETEELSRALAGDGSTEKEMGDVLFSAVNVCRLLGLDAEDILHAATEKFIRRFESMERLALRDGFPVETLSPDRQNAYWDKAKALEGKA